MSLFLMAVPQGEGTGWMYTSPSPRQESVSYFVKLDERMLGEVLYLLTYSLWCISMILNNFKLQLLGEGRLI